jgi:hypothetical protein
MESARRRRIVRLLAVVGCVAATVGCGGGADSNVPARQLPSYLALFPPDQPLAVYFLQWQRRGDEVDGTLTVVYPTSRDTPQSIHRVEGEIDGPSVRLDVGEDSPQRWDGTRQGRRIDFDVELESGSEQQITFTPATLAAYKRAVAKVRAGG